VLSIKNPEEVRAMYDQGHGDRVKDEATIKKVSEQAKQYLGDAEVSNVFKAPDADYYFVDAKGIGTFATIGADGQLLSFQREVKGNELPQPVRQTIDQMFSNATRSYRGEEAFFQFDQQTQTGNAVVVKMRPNGDILDVINDQAAQEEKAVTAKAKQGKTATPATPAKKTGA